MESYPESGGVMMGEDDARVAEAINEALAERERLELSEVLSATLEALQVEVPSLQVMEEVMDWELMEPFERCERPGWKKMKWQEVEDQRLVREKRRRGLSNEEQKAAKEQIFNSNEAFNILSNELFSLQTQVTPGIQTDAVDFNVYHWAVRLQGFTGALAADMEALKESMGYDYVELQVIFKEDLHPFYPPSFSVVRPRLQGSYDVQAALACHPRLQLKGWSPFQSSRELLVSVRHFLDRIARVDLQSVRNDVVRYPSGAFSPLEQALAQLQRLRGLRPDKLRLDVEGNAYEQDPWAQSSTLRSFKDEAQAPAQGHWAKGVGYGSEKITGRSWDPATMHAAQQTQDLELQQVVSSICADLAGEEDVGELLSKSCILPFLEGELLTSYTDMAERPQFFQEVFKLLELTLKLLPELTLALRARLQSCKDSAQTFLQSLAGQELGEDDTALAQQVVSLAVGSPTEAPVEPLGYCQQLREFQLGFGDMLDHCFADSARQETAAPQARSLRLAKEFAGLGATLPLSESSMVLVRSSQRQQQLWRALVTGPLDTPYSGGCFIFDVYFPFSYPSSPPQVRLLTTGGDTVCFNPNLYSNGKVCLSLLGTWQGERSENWDSKTSRAVQVLISIQSLILVPEPYFNEPGFEREIGTEEGQRRSKDYNRSVRENCVRWAMLDVLKNPKKEFQEAIRLHFKLQAEQIRSTISGWLQEEPVHHRGVLEDLLRRLDEELRKL